MSPSRCFSAVLLAPSGVPVLQASTTTLPRILDSGLPEDYLAPVKASLEAVPQSLGSTSSPSAPERMGHLPTRHPVHCRCATTKSVCAGRRRLTERHRLPRPRGGTFRCQSRPPPSTPQRSARPPSLFRVSSVFEVEKVSTNERPALKT